MDVPEYDFATHSRSTTTHRVEPADVVIVEGLFVLHMESIRCGVWDKCGPDLIRDVMGTRGGCFMFL